MAQSTPPEAILDVGRRLVTTLGLADSVDTLARWMAHTLAEKLDAADRATGGDRTAAQAEAIDLILKLWAHRRDLPPGHRPFEDLEATARVLKRLDPEDTSNRFFGLERFPPIEGAPEAAKVWLQRALEIDNAARTAIRYCIQAADDATPGDRADWAQLAEAADLERDVEVSILRFVGSMGAARRGDAPDDAAARALRRDQEKAVVLKDAGAAIAADLARKLKTRKRRKKAKSTAPDAADQT